MKQRIIVKTLDEEALHSAARQLVAKVQSDFIPSIVIGIRTGGYIVAEAMMHAFPSGTLLLPITCRRPSTKRKSKFSSLKTLLVRLPYRITNKIRVAEHILLTRKKLRNTHNSLIDAMELASLETIIKNNNAAILIVDDAVDSGATLAAVIEHISKATGNSANIKTAAITVTTDTPIHQPDYRLYSHVLCRFHWSLDFRG